MIEAGEKSTAAPEPVARAEVGDGVVLDGRLALWHPKSRWLAVADIHFGYEVSRRAAGGLWPLWGMASIAERLVELLEDTRPERLILAGDIVDGGAAGREALAWIDALHEHCGELICVAGNHDRGAIRRAIEFVDSFACDGFFFHHGHQIPEIPEGHIEVCGHWHPSWSPGDGAGTRLRLPTLVQERHANTGRQRWILPAFSPWAGGGRWVCRPGSTVTQWACSPQRVFQVA